MSSATKYTRGHATFNIVSKAILAGFATACLLPFILMIIGSFTDNTTVLLNGYSLFPEKWSIAAYELIFKYPKQVVDAYKVTIFVTAVGTAIALTITTISGYALSRPTFRSRNKIALYLYFPSLFGGGLIPWYIMMTQVLRLSDSIWALIIPSLVSTYNIFLVRNFIRTSVPLELFESAKIDGAGELRTFGQIILPLITPVTATVGLFIALGYWNDWFLSNLFITTPSKYSLQYYLYNMLYSSKALQELKAISGGDISIDIDLPSETAKLAMAVVATGPIIMLYPFVQRYFVKGLVIGSVKG